MDTADTTTPSAATGSYSNPGVQSSDTEKSLRLIEMAVRQLGHAQLEQKLMLIADFGAGHGYISKKAMDEIQKSLRDVAGYRGKFLTIHNDLPTSNWQQFFQTLSRDSGCGSLGCGRSFHRQCLPDETLTVGYSSLSLHWLSQMPCEVSGHCYAGFSGDPDVVQRFERQAYEDYALFLRHRHRELVPGGVLILALQVSPAKNRVNYGDHMFQLYECGMLELPRDVLSYFSLPFYFLTSEQYTRKEVLEGFDLISARDVLVEMPLFDMWKHGAISLEEFADRDAQYIRGWSEPALKQALLRAGRGKENVPDILDSFYRRYAQLTMRKASGLDSHGYYARIVLRKKSSPDRQ